MTKTTIQEVESRLGGNENLTIVDSRAADAWAKAETKAAGAIRIPPDEAEKHVADVSRDDFVVIYCT
jgi:rhodanese-related sulfurtransferase